METLVFKYLLKHIMYDDGGGNIVRKPGDLKTVFQACVIILGPPMGSSPVSLSRLWSEKYISRKWVRNVGKKFKEWTTSGNSLGDKTCVRIKFYLFILIKISPNLKNM